MKKYHQLLLLTVSVISLTLLLIYRHQYNRLHYVLEVFNFFGQPCNVSGLEVNDNVVVQDDWGPTPIWQEIDSMHMYSAFWTDKDEVKVVVINHDKDLKPRDCYLWFEDKKEPVIGKFKYSNIDTDNAEANFYTCSLPEYKHIPYAVSFSTKFKKHLKSILVKPISRSIAFNTTICVLPSDIFNKREFIEFLSFHSLIGIDSYIFYTDNISHRLQQIIRILSSKLNITVTFFPWNFNFNNNNKLIERVIETDCLLRALPSSKNIITLRMNEYFVPSMPFGDILKMLKNYSQKIHLPVKTFCIKDTHQRRPVALQNTHVTYFNNNLVKVIFRNVKSSDQIIINRLNKDLASVHSYVYCNDTKARIYADKSMLKYSTDFVRSTLMQLFLHDHI